MSEKQAYLRKLRAQLTEWNAELDMLKADTQEANSEANVEYERKIEELHQKSGEALKTLTKIQKASDDTWEEFIEGAEKTWNSFREAFSKAKSEFRRGYREGREGSNRRE